MTGSARSSNAVSDQLRAPYAAPHNSAPLPAHVVSAQRLAVLPPFVPQSFRESSGLPFIDSFAHDDPPVTVASVASPAESDATSDAYAQALHERERDEFDNASAYDSRTGDDTWPMGEAAKRLDELTQSLSSIDASRDASRALQHSTDNDEETNSSATDPNTSHAMWSDDEWMDIMPTSAIIEDEPSTSFAAVDIPAGADTTVEAHADSFENGEPSGDELSQFNDHVDFANAESAAFQHADQTARALEVVAARIRAGDIPVPAVQSDLGDAAVLAGVLAALLGWRR